ncbi:MAG TPA: sulfotransferase domain-containing protein [Terriglobales bacterium]|nr:sulfotransferase domain-containing protein [Terriglobales bacterium]
MGKIIWLASYPKSGNTWMRTFIHNLLRDPKDGYDINKITDFSTNDSAIARFKLFLKKPWQEWSEQDVMDVRFQVQRQICAEHIDDRFIKTHNCLILYGGRPLIYPEFTAGAIYIIRNPLDVAISLSHHYSVDIDEAIEILGGEFIISPGTDRNVFEVHRSWSLHVASWTLQTAPNRLVVRYEDMLDHARPTFGRVARFLGLTPDVDRLTRAIENSSFDKLRDQEDKQGFKERPAKAERFFRSGKANQWREVLTGAQIDKVVNTHRDQMKRWGYWPLPK